MSEAFNRSGGEHFGCNFWLLAAHEGRAIPIER